MKEHQVNSPEKLLYFMNEVRLLSQCYQKHVVEITTASVSGTLIKARGIKKTAVYYVMAHARYGEIYRLIKETGRLSEIQARTFFSQLLDGKVCDEVRIGLFAWERNSTP
jgi:serine/threonine protein kinase